MKSWLSSTELALRLAQACLEALPVHALLLAVCTLSGASLRLGLARVISIFLGNVLLAAFSAHGPGGFTWQRIILVSVSTLGLAVWLHGVIAPAAGWAPTTWRAAILAPWQLGRPIGGAQVLLAWLAGAYSSGRGLLIGVAEPGRSSIARQFPLGIALFVLLFAFLARADVTASLPVVQLRTLALSYFALGLFLTALERQRAAFLLEGIRPQLSAAFMLAFGVPSLALFLVTYLMLGSMHALAFSWSSVAAVVHALALGLWIALHWLAHALAWALRWLGSLASAPGADRRSADDAHGASWDGPSTLHPLALPHLPPDLGPAVWIASASLVIALFLIVLWKRPARQQPLEAAEESSSLWSLELFAQQWSAAWRALVARVRSEARALTTPRPASSLTPLVLNTLRDVYRALLSWAERRGHLRAPATTPLEFAQQLARDLPQHRERFRELTLRYSESRYGERIAAAAELERAKQLLRELGQDDPSA